MPFAINPFIASMVGDGARPNLFEIIFPELGALFTLRAHITALPSSIVGIAPVYYFGRAVKLGGNRVFEELQASVLIDEIDLVSGPRAALERWSDRINSHVGNIRSAVALPPSGYFRDCTVIQYSKMGAPIGTYAMWGAWPTQISAMPLDWGNNNTISTFQVTFALNGWSSVNTT